MKTRVLGCSRTGEEVIMHLGSRNEVKSFSGADHALCDSIVLHLVKELLKDRDGYSESEVNCEVAGREEHIVDQWLRVHQGCGCRKLIRGASKLNRQAINKLRACSGLILGSPMLMVTQPLDDGHGCRSNCAQVPIALN